MDGGPSPTMTVRGQCRVSVFRRIGIIRDAVDVDPPALPCNRHGGRSRPYENSFAPRPARLGGTISKQIGFAAERHEGAAGAGGAALLSRRKSAMGLVVGGKRAQHLAVDQAGFLQPPRGPRVAEVAVDVKSRHVGRVEAGTAGGCRAGALEAKLVYVERGSLLSAGQPGRAGRSGTRAWEPPWSGHSHSSRSGESTSMPWARSISR